MFDHQCLPLELSILDIAVEGKAVAVNIPLDSHSWCRPAGTPHCNCSHRSFEDSFPDRSSALPIVVD